MSLAASFLWKTGVSCLKALSNSFSRGSIGANEGQRSGNGGVPEESGVWSDSGSVVSIYY